MDNNDIKQLNDFVIESFEKPDEKERLSRAFRLLRLATGMNRKELSSYLHIPYNTMRDWEQGQRAMPPYVFELIAYKLKNESMFLSNTDSLIGILSKDYDVDNERENALKRKYELDKE